MKKDYTKKVVMSSLFAALICVVTAFVKVPMPLVGYVNLGDALVLCAGALLGPMGVVSAMIGSAIADVIAGFAMYVPATAVIKGLMALIVWLFVKKNESVNMIKFVISAVIAELVMVAGYFAYECLLYGEQTALVSVPYNFLQGGLSLVCACVIMVVLKKTNIKEKF